MNVLREDLYNKDQTGAEMKRLVTSYASDLQNIFVKYQSNDVSLANLPIDVFFDTIKNIKYVRDPKPTELVMRPYYAIKFNKKGLDCKKKAILMASYAYINNIPYRFIASSTRPDGKKHHVYTQLQIDGQWINFDCTYNDYTMGMEKENETANEVL